MAPTSNIWIESLETNYKGVTHVVKYRLVGRETA